MYGIPGNLPGVNAPANITHGRVIYRSNLALFAGLESFRGVVPEGVTTIWVTFACGGSGTDTGANLGASSAAFFQQPLSVTPGAQWDLVMASQGAGGGGGVASGSMFTCCGNTLTLSGINPPPGTGGTAAGMDNKGAAIVGLPGGSSTAVGISWNVSPLGYFGAGGSVDGKPGICIVEW